MRFNFLVVFAALSIAFIGCRKGEEIGREVQVGDNDILLLTTDSFHISASTVLSEPERTDERFEAMIGAYEDPVFGPSILSFTSQYHLEQPGFSFGSPDTVVFDSAFVSYRITGGYRTINYTSDDYFQAHFKVYELNEDLLLDDSYFSDKEIITKSQVIGEFNGLMNLNDSLYLEQGQQPAQVRIRLDDNWAKQLMFSNPSVFTSNETFVQHMKGLALIPELIPGAGDQSAIVYFAPVSSYTCITLHYHTPNDTVLYRFETDVNTASFSNFKHDYPNAPVGAALNDTAVGAQTLFLQSTIGTDAIIDLTDLLDQLGPDPKIINLANIIIPVDTSTEYPVLNKLSLKRVLDDGSFAALLDQAEPEPRNIDGSYYSADAEYRFQVTRYIQNLIQTYDPNSPSNKEKLIISPFGANVLANRSIITGPRPNDPDAPKMKLIISYTPL
jgi:hypothetical protein